MNKQIQIGSRVIGHGQPAFIIAEIGINHGGSVDTAKRMIEAAKSSDVDAVKFQTINPEESYTPESKSYQIFKDRELTKDQYYDLVAFCHELDIIFLTTPGDYSSLALCHELKLPAYKISSGLMTNIPLMLKAIESGVPLIISTGASYLWEIGKIIYTLEQYDFYNMAFLHCVTQYPAQAEQLNLRALQTMSHAFPYPVGYSDHYPGNTACIAAVTLGACIIEKHFTIDDKEIEGADDPISLNPAQMKQLVQEIRECEQMLTKNHKEPHESEFDFRQDFRRFLVATRDIPAGHYFIKDDIAAKRKPGHTGFPPEMLPHIIGKQTVRNLQKNEPVSWDAISTCLVQGNEN